jgi:DNA replication protein
MLDQKGTNELIRIAAAGGGFTLNGQHRTPEDLMRIAAAASITGARLTLTNIGSWPANDLIRIAAAGKGAVTFA